MYPANANISEVISIMHFQHVEISKTDLLKVSFKYHLKLLTLALAL